MNLANPLKSMTVAQPFGGNPDYYARFHDQFGQPEKGHMGIDFVAPHGTPVYAAIDGDALYEKDAHGGEGIIIRTAPMDYNGQQAIYHVINWHLCGDTDPKYPSPIPLDGNPHPVKTGDLIGYADNTGAPFESSGDHLHFGLQPLTENLQIIEAHNGFNGCIDPAPYLPQPYTPPNSVPYEQAVTSLYRDNPTEPGLVARAIALLKKVYHRQ